MTAQTCPRRMTELGPWHRTQGNDTWGERDGKLRCSFCGSLHPDDVIARLTAGEQAGPTDKNYKVYVGNHDKAYFQHFDKAHMEAFLALYNAQAMNVGMPGHFYKLPFFMSYQP